MRTAGMFAELSRIKQDEPQDSIFRNVLTAPLDDVDRVVAYLRAGHPLIGAMDVRDDVFDRGEQVMNGPSIVTDGDWLWRQDFAHYVGRRNVAVPADFLALIRSRDYAVPELEEEILERCADEAEVLLFGAAGDPADG